MTPRLPPTAFAGEARLVWRSAEVQCIDLRIRSRDDLAAQLEAAALEAAATGCRRLVIELGGLDELALLGALEGVGELMRSRGGEVTVRRSRRTVVTTRNQRSWCQPRKPAEPIKWAA
jgi:hypothetical protein